MKTGLVSATAAAARAGIKRETLYAYVSRGLLHAHSVPGKSGSWFHPVELDALVRRARHPAERQHNPPIKSAVTLIEGGAYYYRGVTPESLARSSSFEDVAEWLWLGERKSATSWPVDHSRVRRVRAALRVLPTGVSPNDAIRLAVAVLGSGDALRFDLRPAGVAATGRRLIATTVAALGPGAGRTCVAEGVAAWLGARRTPDVIRAVETALILIADHELAVSTLAVRVAASFRSDPYSAVLAGLGPMSSPFHGAASRKVEQVLRDVADGASASAVVGDLLKHEGAVPGFGHPLYPDGDPRVPLLLRRTGTLETSARTVQAVLRTAQAQGVGHPNVDFALAALTHRLKLPVGAGEAIFTIGRLAGWLAHAIEEYSERSAFRFRALYVGDRTA